jgi:hypothetical protein
VAKASIVVFWIMMLHIAVNGYQHFGGVFVSSYKTTQHQKSEDHSQQKMTKD